MRRSRPLKESSAAIGSSRSSPMSRAKWLRVPNGTQTNGRSRSSGHLRHLRERPVAAGHPERLGVGPTRELRGVVALAEDVNGDAAFLGGRDELIRARGVVARARIDEEETGYPAPFSESPSWRSSAPLGWAPSAAAAGSPSLKSTMVGIDAIP